MRGVSTAEQHRRRYRCTESPAVRMPAPAIRSGRAACRATAWHDLAPCLRQAGSVQVAVTQAHPPALFFRATWARFGSISCFLRVRRWDYGLIATGWRCARSWRTRPRTGRSHLRERVFHRRSRRAPTTRARLRRAPERRSTKSSVTVAMVRAPKGRKRRGRKTLLGTSQGGLLGRRLCI